MPWLIKFPPVHFIKKILNIQKGQSKYLVWFIFNLYKKTKVTYVDCLKNCFWITLYECMQSCITATLFINIYLPLNTTNFLIYEAIFFSLLPVIFSKAHYLLTFSSRIWNQLFLHRTRKNILHLQKQKK